MRGAISLVRALATHAKHVLGPKLAQRSSDQDYVLKRIQVWPTCFTESQLREAAKGRGAIGGASDLASILDDLESMGCIRRVPQDNETGRPGRKRSPLIELHPLLNPKVEVVEI